MTTLDAARERDRTIPDVDWHVFPEGTVRDVFPAPSGELARVRLGDACAPRVLLVPGMIGSKEDFVRIFPLLAAGGYRVESFDLAGHYESAAAGPGRLDPPRDRFDLELFMDDLLAILDDGEPAHVLGYSFGAVLAQVALAERPGMFRSLTLMSAPPAVGQVFRTVKSIGAFSDVTPERGAGLILWGVRYNLNRMPPQRIAFVRERLDTIERSTTDDVVRLLMQTPDVRAAVAAADIPKLLTVGRHDMWPLSEHRAYASDIGARVAVYPSGHAPAETSPHQLAHDMLALFRDARP